MSTLTFDGTALVYRTPYNPLLVAELKTQIPASDRQWDGTSKAWRIAPTHAPLLAALTEQYLGERIVIPTIPQPTNQTETRILEIKYIGQTKDRGGAERSAFGWANGGWTVILPENVLRDWFDAPQRPDEETTLYQVLSIKREAAGSDIKSAYRRLSRQWHPDVCREPGAAEVFMRIKSAYDLLSDPAKRARYDAGLQLAATLGRQADAVETVSGYRSPLRCGLLMCAGIAQLARFVVSQILAWEDITDAQGRILSVSWPAGADKFVEMWV